MKIKFYSFWIIVLLLTACSPAAVIPSSMDIAATQTAQSTPEVSTAVANSGSLENPPTKTVPSVGNVIPESGITFDDNGKSFTLQTGDSFLLNLGDDAYEWEVSVDNESVLQMKRGVMVIKGAQGIYDALAPGTAIVNATGNPLCLQSRPPCGLRSILFSVTIIVH